MAQLVSELNAFPANGRSVPSSHVKQLMTGCNSSSRASDTLRHVKSYEHIHTQTWAHVNIIKNKFKR